MWVRCALPGCIRKKAESDAFETSAMVVDDVMFITEPPNVVRALSAKTGRTLWTYRKDIPKDLRLCCGRVNRGVAVLNDTVYYASIDAHLIALDASTGIVRWDVTMADYKTGHSSTGAPLAVRQDYYRSRGGRVWRSRLYRRL